MSMNVETGLPYMLSVEDARERILNMFEVLETERKPLLDALGQTLAEDVSSTLDIPPLTNSAMDGYAVRHEATSPARARPTGSSCAWWATWPPESCPRSLWKAPTRSAS